VLSALQTLPDSRHNLALMAAQIQVMQTYNNRNEHDAPGT